MKKRIKRILITAALCLIFILPAKASLGRTNYVIEQKGKVSIPVCYTPEAYIDRVTADSYFNTPRNMYLDSADNLFVADSGNNRIVRFDAELKYTAQFTAGGTLNQPSGAYYDEKTGELYIADTENERVAVVDKNDKIIREYFKPDSELLNEDLRFNPNNISLGTQGYLYVLKGQYFMQVSQDGEFKGFVGSTRVAASLTSLLIRRFASEKQKELLTTEQPSPYLNFTMDQNGVIYAVASTSTSQIRKINMAGDNLFPEQFYGERIADVSGKFVNPNFISIGISNDGIISVLEENSKRIYQYAQDGTMLSVFGGEGEVAGFFTTPVSIAVDSKGGIFVADSSTNSLQYFSRTAFSAATYKAQSAYDEGRYEDAYALYEEARELNPNYAVVNNRIAKCLYKLDRVEEAAEAYYAADNRSGYGSVQADLRREFIKKYFGWLCLAAAAVIAGFVLLIRTLKRYTDRLISRFYKLND